MKVVIQQFHRVPSLMGLGADVPICEWPWSWWCSCTWRCLPVFYLMLVNKRTRAKLKRKPRRKWRHREPAARTGALAGADDSIHCRPALRMRVPYCRLCPLKAVQACRPYLAHHAGGSLCRWLRLRLFQSGSVDQAVGGTEYVIASGDNFWTIGRKFGVSAKQIEQANPSVVLTRMKIGQKINIPALAPVSTMPTVAPVVDDGSTYTVKSGDTLGHIALQHKVKLRNSGR